MLMDFGEICLFDLAEHTLAMLQDLSIFRGVSLEARVATAFTSMRHITSCMLVPVKAPVLL